MGMKNLHKVLKVALYMYMIYFFYNVLSKLDEVPQALKSSDILCYPKGGGGEGGLHHPFRIICKDASNKNDRLCQGTSHKHIHQPDELWKN